jgi:hypothetical protein
MRRRLPSPAVVVASLALFVALAGSGAAASYFIVRDAKPVMLIAGAVDSAGKVSGPRVTGARESAGVYTLTIRGDTFAPSRKASTVQVALSTLFVDTKAAPRLPSCGVSSQNLASNGSATLEVECFTYDPAAGWQPTDAAFDFQVVGPSR